MKNNSFERLNNGLWKRIIIGGVGVSAILLVGILATSKAKYRLIESINIVNGTINYTVPDFKVMAMYTSEDGENYTEITTMPESGYVINEEKTYCTTDNINQVKGKIKTENGKVILQSLKKGDKCYLYFDIYQPSASEIILANVTVDTDIPNFGSVAVVDEGVYALEDGMYGGTSYYWRGAVTNNYVKFAGYCWRIVRINGDGSIRLIYDGESCHANGTNTTDSIAKMNIQYNTNSNQSNYVGWTYEGTSQRTLSGTSSNAKTQLESWYSNNITGTNATKVATGKFCNDREVKSDNTWAINGSTFYYRASERLQTNKAPSLDCSSKSGKNDVYNLKVGAITADEVVLAGGGSSVNDKYYLYNGQNYWTMSPCWWNGGSSWAIVFYVFTTGSLNSGDVSNATKGLRPVINLNSNVTFSSGNGQKGTPFIVAD